MESNGIKTDGDFFGIYMIFGKKNPRDTMLEGPTRVRGATRGQARPYLVATSGIVSCGFFFQKIIYIPKKSLSVFIPLGVRLIWIFCETKNMQQTGTGTGHWINMLVPKIV